jgi:ankyrin repeat protein
VGLEFLLQNDAGLNAVDRRGWSPLHYAAHHDNAGCARVLINRGAMINLQDQDGKSPLVVAAESHSRTTRTLLEAEYARRGIDL